MISNLNKKRKCYISKAQKVILLKTIFVLETKIYSTLRWIGHIQRISDNRIIKKIYEARASSKRSNSLGINLK